MEGGACGASLLVGVSQVLFCTYPLDKNASEQDSLPLMSSSRIATLLAWCAENRVQIDPRLQIVDSEETRHLMSSDEPSGERGFSVYSRDEPITCTCTRESPAFSSQSSLDATHVRASVIGEINHSPLLSDCGDFGSVLRERRVPQRVLLCALTYLWLSQSFTSQRPPFCRSSRAPSPSISLRYLMVTVLIFRLLSRSTANCA